MRKFYDVKSFPPLSFANVNYHTNYCVSEMEGWRKRLDTGSHFVSSTALPCQILQRANRHMVWPAIISPLKHQTEAHLTLIKHPCVEEGGGGSILDYSLNKYYCMNFDCIHSWDRQSEARQSYQRLTPLPNRQENRPGYNPTETTHNSTATTQTGTFHSNKSCVLVWIKKEIRDIN